MSNRDTASLLQVEQFLAGRFGAGVADVRLLGQGEWSSAYAFRLAGADLVARFGALEEDFAKDRLAARYATPALPIPRVIELGSALDGFYCVSERRFGVFLESLREVELRASLPSLFAALDAAREVDLSGTSGFGLWHADGNAPAPSWREWLLSVRDDSPAQRIHGWRTKLEQHPAGAAAFAQGYTTMAALLWACSEQRHLIHADLLHENVLVEGARLTGVFDWGCALYGDFLYDVAWLSFWAPWSPGWERIDFAAEARRHYATIGLNVPYFSERLRCYELHIGLDGLIYSSFKSRLDDVAAIAQRVITLIDAPLLG